MKLSPTAQGLRQLWSKTGAHLRVCLGLQFINIDFKMCDLKT
jgi:hypothetical protein